jgi:ADP-heptose:LPS heptosyltransferase
MLTNELYQRICAVVAPHTLSGIVLEEQRLTIGLHPLFSSGIEQRLAMEALANLADMLEGAGWRVRAFGYPPVGGRPYLEATAKGPPPSPET